MTKRQDRRNDLTRRDLLARTAATSLAFAIGATPSVLRAQDGAFAGKEVRVLTWADATGQAAVRHIFRTFEEATGARVIADLTGTTSEMVARIRASAASPQHDVVILSGVGAVELANAGLLNAPDESQLPNLERVFEDYRLGAGGFGVGYFLWSDGLAFNTQTFADPPTSYGVLWDEAHAGRIFVPPPNTIMAMELVIAAARMAGGDQMNPEPGFQLLESLRPNVLTISSNAGQLAELFRSNSLDAGGPYSPLEIGAFIQDPEYNVSGTFDLEEGFFTDLQFMVIPKDHPGDDDVTHGLVNHALDPQVQAAMAEEVWYGPVNQDAQLSEAALQSPYIASPEVIAARVVAVDTEHLASVRSEWTQRYTEIFAG